MCTYKPTNYKVFFVKISLQNILFLSTGPAIGLATHSTHRGLLENQHTA